MGQDVVDLIMQDHREVERLFEELRSVEARAGLVPLLVTLLTAHSRAEEAEVYPAARDEAGIADDVAHSQEEHIEADELLAKLASLPPDSADFDSMLAELVDAVTHHIGEEEDSVLPGLRSNLSQTRLLELGEAFLATRAEHLGEFPEDVRKADLEQQAENLGMTGASNKSKAQLQQDLRRQAEQSEE